MSSFILLFVCLLIGMLLRRVPAFPAATPLALNQFVIYISLPALALLYIPEIELHRELLLPVAVAWICFGVSALLFGSLGRVYGWSRKLTGCLILMSGLSNTSFVGFPIIEALYGESGLKIAILVDQPGSFVALSTVGIAVAAAFSKGEASAKGIVKKIFTFPPLLSFFVALAMSLLGLHFPDALKDVFQRLGSTVTPLALVSVGMQLRVERHSKHWRFLFLGLAYQLVLAPAIIYGLYAGLFNARAEIVQVCVMEAAMSPMIAPSIVAATYGLKPRLANMMVGFGLPLSFITLVFWYWVVSGF
ncbi:AEC family transporter [Pontibacter qinzhouensis]|uniref:AEC family transporter n=1 Tax=Pontibacter qinzhouensis TaxID=2603253 RepID=A0A5C8IYP3_9BACT|nr:AEC family transporter [Pontibacter qinzhouensis]TXK26410.1 AEC family transporter [Pontibacter qinzhouensis]